MYLLRQSSRTITKLVRPTSSRPTLLSTICFASGVLSKSISYKLAMSTSDPVTSSVEALASVSLSTQAAPPAEKAKPLPPGQRKVHEAAQAEANAAAKKAAGKTTKSSKKKAANPDFVAIFNERFSNVQGEYIDTHCHIDYILDRFNTEKVPFPASSTVASTASEGATAAGDASSTTAANTAAFADTCCAPKTSCVSSTSSAEGKEGESKSKPLVPGPWSWSTLTSELILGNCPALVTVCCDADTHDRILELIDTAHKAAEAQATEAQSAVLSSSSEAKQPEQQQKQQRRPAPVLVGAFGLHPHNAKEWNEAIQAKLEQAMSHPRVVAWGECGLDYYYENSPRDVQKKVFAIQMGLAVKHGKPLVVHSRDAEEDTLELMMKHLPQDWKIHLHCCTSSRKLVEPLLAHFPNLRIGFTGCITFPNADPIRDTLSVVPVERLLLETDAPFMAPLPFRSLPAHPGMILFTAEKMAEVKGVKLEELLAQVRKNTNFIYDI